MKQFLQTNWYKLMIGSSFFIFSVGFFFYSISSVYAGKTDSTSIKSEKKVGDEETYSSVIGCGSGIYEVWFVKGYGGNNRFGSDQGWNFRRIGPQ